MEAVVLHRVLFLDYFCPKQGQDFKPSAAPVYPNMGKVPPPPSGEIVNHLVLTSWCQCQPHILQLPSPRFQLPRHGEFSFMQDVKIIPLFDWLSGSRHCGTSWYH